MEEKMGVDLKSATEASENKKLFIETYGCQMNVADSEVVASIMQMAGYSLADSLAEADAVFMNTCSIVTMPNRRFSIVWSFSKLCVARVEKLLLACWDVWPSA